MISSETCVLEIRDDGEDVHGPGYGLCSLIEETQRAKRSVVGHPSAGKSKHSLATALSSYRNEVGDLNIQSHWCDYGMYCTNNGCKFSELHM